MPTIQEQMTLWSREPNLVDEAELRNFLNKVTKGEVRAAVCQNGVWLANEWVKQAILLAFRVFEPIRRPHDGFDKFGLLPLGPAAPRYRRVPGGFIRDFCHIGDGCVIMPSCINIGAYIGSNSMIDMNATIGSCAQIGKNCHIAANACIGGVLEPLNATPVILEDNVFVGAQSAVLEGVVVRENAVIAAGVILSASTKIIERQSGKITYGEVPVGAVVIPGSYPSGGININCAIITKYLDATVRAKTGINEILRD